MPTGFDGTLAGSTPRFVAACTCTRMPHPHLPPARPASLCPPLPPARDARQGPPGGALLPPAAAAATRPAMPHPSPLAVVASPPASAAASLLRPGPRRAVALAVSCGATLRTAPPTHTATATCRPRRTTDWPQRSDFERYGADSHVRALGGILPTDSNAAAVNAAGDRAVRPFSPAPAHPAADRRRYALAMKLQ